MREVDVWALKRLKENRRSMTRQQYRTLRGQVIAGDVVGAMKGLRKVLLTQGTNTVKQ